MIQELNTLREEFKKLNYNLYSGETDLIVKLTRTTKMKTEKQVFFYSFRTTQQAVDYCSKYLNNLLEQQIKKEQKKLDDANIAASVKVGDIFSYSWGWEQTNCQFYQVIRKVSDKTIVVREIGYRQLESCSWASCYVTAVKDSFLENSKEETVRLSGKYFTRSFGYARLVDMNDPRDSKHYMSWYA